LQGVVAAAVTVLVVVLAVAVARVVLEPLLVFLSRRVLLLPLP
jgi:hypothetical protein